MAKFDRITVAPAQMGGVPCIRHLRIPVATIVGLVAEGMSDEQVLRDYPDLELQSIRRGAFVWHHVRSRASVTDSGCLMRFVVDDNLSIC